MDYIPKWSQKQLKRQTQSCNVNFGFLIYIYFRIQVFSIYLKTAKTFQSSCIPHIQFILLVGILYFIFLKIIVQLQLSAFTLHYSPQPQPNPPPSLASTPGLGFGHVSFIVVPENPSPLPPLSPLNSPQFWYFGCMNSKKLTLITFFLFSVIFPLMFLFCSNYSIQFCLHISSATSEQWLFLRLFLFWWPCRFWKVMIRMSLK